MSPSFIRCPLLGTAAAASAAGAMSGSVAAAAAAGLSTSVSASVALPATAAGSFTALWSACCSVPAWSGMILAQSDSDGWFCGGACSSGVSAGSDMMQASGMRLQGDTSAFGTLMTVRTMIGTVLQPQLAQFSMQMPARSSSAACARAALRLLAARASLQESR